MACADVSSANVVGYAGVQLNAGGKDMISGTFMKVSGQDTIALSTLKVTGYENSEMYLYGYMGFTATFQIRKTNGSPEATYLWSDAAMDPGDGTLVWEGGKWKDADTMIEITPKNDVNFPVGKGFWFDCPDLEDCEAFYLQSSGQVIKGDYGFELNAGGKIGACNVMPVDTTLSQVEVQGYEDSEMYLYGYMGFTLTMQKLKNNGSPQATYLWSDAAMDPGDGSLVWEGGKWKDADTMVEITKDNDVAYPAGKGFWVDCPDLEDCDAFVFAFPKCLAE